jgi:hypothetical protein
MPYDENTAERVRRALLGRPGLEEMMMMGGVCFMVGGPWFAASQEALRTKARGPSAAAVRSQEGGR